ncbi:MAG: hypothetical protein LBH51_03070 [Treponema sp.]|nr:hypothetical protein [Treponema sp.]
MEKKLEAEVRDLRFASLAGRRDFEGGGPAGTEAGPPGLLVFRSSRGKAPRTPRRQGRQEAGCL